MPDSLVRVIASKLIFLAGFWLAIMFVFFAVAVGLAITHLALVDAQPTTGAIRGALELVRQAHVLQHTVRNKHFTAIPHLQYCN